MKKVVAMLAVALFAAQGAMANTGWNNSYLNVTSGGTTWYDLNGADQGAGNFNGANLGSFSLGYSLTLGSEINAFADGGDTFSTMSLYYRIDGGSWTEVADNTIDNIGGTNFRGITTGADLGGLGVGGHTVEAYVSRSHTWSGGGPYTTYLNTTGDVGGGVEPADVPPAANFFAASFTVVPEPATMALFGMGLAGLMVARRRLA